MRLAAQTGLYGPVIPPVHGVVTSQVSKEKIALASIAWKKDGRGGVTDTVYLTESLFGKEFISPLSSAGDAHYEVK